MVSIALIKKLRGLSGGDSGKGQVQVKEEIFAEEEKPDMASFDLDEFGMPVLKREDEPESQNSGLSVEMFGVAEVKEDEIETEDVFGTPLK